MDVAARRAAQELGRRGVELVDELEVNRGPRRNLGAGLDADRGIVVLQLGAKRREAVRGELDAVLAQRLAHPRSIEEVRRGDEAVPAAPDPLQRQPRGLGLAQQLGHAGARQPHLRGEVFAGVESAVRKLAQERESERSKH